MEKWIGNNKSVYIYNGVNVRDIKRDNTIENKKVFRHEFKISSNEKLFVSVGRLIQQKKLPAFGKSDDNRMR
jgi:glycosyltransferase involved in cell wall biosynthesis